MQQLKVSKYFEEVKEPGVGPVWFQRAATLTRRLEDEAERWNLFCCRHGE
jgi:hypothetical protein